MKTRAEFGAWLTSCGYSRVAEIGVAAGVFSYHVLNNWTGGYTMIDPWSHQSDGYVDVSNFTDDEHEQNYQRALGVARHFAPRVQVLRSYSVEAAKTFPDSFFDVVYLDGNHSYEALLEDLHAWMPKVRSGGAMAGHDYLDGVLPQGIFGVKRAVQEFFGRTPDIVTDEDWPSWVMFNSRQTTD